MRHELLILFFVLLCAGCEAQQLAGGGLGAAIVGLLVALKIMGKKNTSTSDKLSKTIDADRQARKEDSDKLEGALQSSKDDRQKLDTGVARDGVVTDKKTSERLDKVKRDGGLSKDLLSQLEDEIVEGKKP